MERDHWIHSIHCPPPLASQFGIIFPNFLRLVHTELQVNRLYDAGLSANPFDIHVGPPSDQPASPFESHLWKILSRMVVFTPILAPTPDPIPMTPQEYIDSRFSVLDSQTASLNSNMEEIMVHFRTSPSPSLSSP
jgi:hypothetical protein